LKTADKRVHVIQKLQAQTNKQKWWRNIRTSIKYV